MTKNSQQWSLMLLTIALSFVFIGCSATTAAPAFAPQATPTVPPDYVTFTDEQMGFQISYPPTWEVDDSNREHLTPEELERMFGVTEEVDFSGVETLFFAGVPRGMNRNFLVANAAVNITIGSLSRYGSIEEYEAEFLDGIRDLRPKTRLVRQDLLQVDGRAASLIEVETASQDLGLLPGDLVRDLSLLFIEGRVPWIVTCTYFYDVGSLLTDTCESVASSFRFLD